jgi:hypothetical protein
MNLGFTIFDLRRGRAALELGGGDGRRKRCRRYRFATAVQICNGLAGRLGFHMVSHGFTWFHMVSHGFTPLFLKIMKLNVVAQKRAGSEVRNIRGIGAGSGCFQGQGVLLDTVLVEGPIRRETELATGKSPEPAGWKACLTFSPMNLRGMLGNSPGRRSEVRAGRAGLAGLAGAPIEQLLPGLRGGVNYETIRLPLW